MIHTTDNMLSRTGRVGIPPVILTLEEAQAKAVDFATSVCSATAFVVSRIIVGKV